MGAEGETAQEPCDRGEPTRTPALAKPTQNALRLLLALLIVYFAGRNLVAVPWSTPPHDFRIYYTSCQAAIEGRNPYAGPDGRLEATTGYLYPLFFLGLVSPLTLLSPPAAEKAWWGLNAVCLVLAAIAAAMWVRRAADGSGFLGRVGIAPWVAACLVLAFSPGAETLRLGQSNILVAGLIAGAAWACVRRRRGWAGALFSLAVLCKGQPLLLLPALAVGLGWPGIATLAATGAIYILGLLATGLWGWEWYFLAEKLPFWATRTDAPTLSLFSILANTHGMAPARALAWAKGFETTVALAYLLGLAALWRRGAGILWLFCWGIVCTLALSRFLEYHHLTILLLPIAALLAAGERTARLEPLVCAVLAFGIVNAGMVARRLLGAEAGYFCYAGLGAAAWGVWRAAWIDPRSPGPGVR